MPEEEDPRPPACQSRRKILYPDEESAWADVPARTRRYHKPLRPYYCEDCDGWHLTSHPRDINGEPEWTLDDLVRKWNAKV